jgi:hypothetical protein
MKIAAFNVENLFDRAKAFNIENQDETTRAIKAVTKLNSVFEKNLFNDQDKERMLELVYELELNR